MQVFTTIAAAMRAIIAAIFTTVTGLPRLFFTLLKNLSAAILDILTVFIHILGHTFPGLMFLHHSYHDFHHIIVALMFNQFISLTDAVPVPARKAIVLIFRIADILHYILLYILGWIAGAVATGIVATYNWLWIAFINTKIGITIANWFMEVKAVVEWYVDPPFLRTSAGHGPRSRWCRRYDSRGVKIIGDEYEVDMIEGIELIEVENEVMQQNEDQYERGERVG